MGGAGGGKAGNTPVSVGIPSNIDGNFSTFTADWILKLNPSCVLPDTTRFKTKTP